MPVYFITFTLCSISGGGVVFQDFWGFTWATASGFVLGVALSFGGVYLLSRKGTVAHEYKELQEYPEAEAETKGALLVRLSAVRGSIHRASLSLSSQLDRPILDGSQSFTSLAETSFGTSFTASVAKASISHARTLDILPEDGSTLPHELAVRPKASFTEGMTRLVPMSVRRTSSEPARGA